MKKKLIFILCGLMAFASSSFSKESFLTYINKYKSLEFPFTLRCMSDIKQYPKINMADLETYYGIPKGELYFEMSDYNEEDDVRYNFRIDSLTSHLIGHYIVDKYISVLVTTVRDSYESDSYARAYYYVFTKEGSLIDRLLVRELLFNPSKYFYAVIYDEKHISTFEYIEDVDNYELVEDRKYGEEFYRKKDPNKPFFYAEKKSYELNDKGKFRQTETKKIDLVKNLSYYIDCPIKEDDPMYLQTESK